MEDQSEGTNLETIITVLENIERDNLSKDEQIIKWLNDVTHPDFQLIDSLITLFMDNIRDLETTGNILKVLRKFDFYNSSNVMPQMKSNPKFPIAISEYIIHTPKKKLSEDAFFILSLIFDYISFKDVATSQFLKAVLDGLDVINDENNFDSVTSILISINFNYTSLSTNNFVEVFKSHKNSRIFIECLIRILNKEKWDKNLMYKVLKCLADVMDTLEDSVMYSSDLETFIDMIISKLESTCTYELRLYTLNVLKRITKYNEYYKTRYKIDQIEFLMDSLISLHDVEEDLKDSCQEILNNLASH